MPGYGQAGPCENVTIVASDGKTTGPVYIPPPVGIALGRVRWQVVRRLSTAHFANNGIHRRNLAEMTGLVVKLER